MKNDILLIDKPLNWTSFDVVKKIRNQIKPSKVGHAGTLDPFAEGVLMLCTGHYTKKVESYMNLEKEYIANITFGSETDTLDLTGKIVNQGPNPVLNKNKIEKILPNFIGTIKQKPPMFSALKQNGVPLYKFAREGINIPRKNRLINIYNIDLLNINKNIITIKVTCGRGTYIRSLAKDIAKKLNTYAFLSSLIRTRIGDFSKNDCVSIDNFKEWISAQA